MVTNNVKQSKQFVVSTADFAFYHKGMLACTGTTNLNTSISVSEQSQDIKAGKGNKQVFTYKYGRELSVDLEAADWRLEYIAMNTGSEIFEGLSDVYSINECVTLTNGIGTLSKVAIGTIGVELPSGVFVQVPGDGTEIDLSSFGLGDTATVRVTYKYNTDTRYITIDADTSPLTGELILDADKHDQKNGKIGSLQIIIPSYSVDGNFDLSFTPDGVSSTKMSGKAQAIDGDTCENNNAVYAYVKETFDTVTTLPIVDITANAPTYNLTAGETTTISVVGSKGSLYKGVSLDNGDCTFDTDASDIATVDANGVVTAHSAGTVNITVGYNDVTDIVTFTVVAASAETE